MAKTKQVQKAGLFWTIICYVTACVLILGPVVMGLINMLFDSSYYEAIDATTLLGRGVAETFSNYLNSVSVIIGIAVFIGVSFVLCLALRIASIEKHFIKNTIIFFIIGLVLRCLAVFTYALPQTSDFLITYELSELLTTIPIGYWGEFLADLNTQYSSVWSAHMPFILYQALIIKSGISPGIMNIFCGMVTCIFTSLLAKELFGKQAFITALIFSAINPLLILFTPIYSNQHPALMFFLAALWIVIKQKNFFGALIGGALLAIAQLIRPEMYVPAIGIIMYYIFRKNDKTKFINAGIFVSVFMIILLITSFTLKTQGMISEHIFNGNLKYKLCVGLNTETCGSWSEADAQLMYDPELLDATFKERIVQPENAPLMVSKVLYQFGNYMYPWISDSSKPEFSDIICRRSVSVYMMIISVIAALKLIKDKERRTKMLPLFLIIFGYMIIYSVTEVQPRYNFTIIPLLTILAADIQETRR